MLNQVVSKTLTRPERPVYGDLNVDTVPSPHHRRGQQHIDLLSAGGIGSKERAT